MDLYRSDSEEKGRVIWCLFGRILPAESRGELRDQLAL